MASGDLLGVLYPHGGITPASNGATLDVRAGTSAVVPVADFDDTTDEYMQWPFNMPDHYGGGGLTCEVIWMASTATANAVVWGLGMMSVTDDVDDIDTKSFAADNTVTATTASVSGEMDYATITFTDGADMDSIAAGEACVIQLTRDANNASDTMSGDAELVMIRITET